MVTLWTPFNSSAFEVFNEQIAVVQENSFKKFILISVVSLIFLFILFRRK